MVRARSRRPTKDGGDDANLASLLVRTPPAGLIRSKSSDTEPRADHERVGLDSGPKGLGI